MTRFLALSLLAGTAAAMSSSKAAMLLDTLWTQTDSNTDGTLSWAEFQNAANALGLDPAILTNADHSGSLQAFFTSIDTNSDGQLTTTELVDAATTYSEYATPLMNLFTNNAGSVPADIATAPPADQFMAKAKITQKYTVDIPPTAIYQGVRHAIAASACAAAGQPVSACTTKVVPSGGFSLTTAAGVVEVGRTRRRQLEVKGGSHGNNKRKLQLAFQDKTKADIQTVIFFPDAATAEANEASLPQSDAEIQTALGAMTPPLAVTVSGYTISEVEAEWELPFQMVGVIGAALVGLGLVTCLIASFCSKQVTKAKQQEAAGCCATGCCSFNAVKSWAFGEFAACILIAGAVFYLYDNMQGLTDILVGLIEITLPGLLNSNIPEIAAIAGMIPDVISVTLAEQVDQFKLLPFAVMGPGVCCILFLFLASVCPLHPRKGTYCCTKIMVLLANLFLLIAFIFYLIFASISVGIKYAPPSVQAEIRGVTGMCDNLASTLGELLGDNAMAVETLKTMGQNVATEEALLADVATLVVTIEGGCAYVNGVFSEFENLFLPGLTCVCAVCYAMFVNNTLCCAAGCCCKAPEGGSKTDSADHVQV